MRHIYFSSLIILTFYLAFSLKAQSNAGVWYFGLRAGVDFRSGQPVACYQGQLNSEEGVAIASDTSGNLLFYTDGRYVWNAHHALMPNGTDLLGHPSSTQSAVIVPRPGSSHLYYLFTVDAEGGREGFRYSLVNMALHDSLGTVDSTQKIFLKAPVTEKLTAVRHRNGRDVWVVVHGWLNDEFYAYLVTPEGVQAEPVISKTGTIHGLGYAMDVRGYLKANPDGTNLALALEESQLFEVFDFDNASGKVSHPVRGEFPAGFYPYGVEFSPDGSLLYISTPGVGKIYQFNLQRNSAQDMLDSATEVVGVYGRQWIGALQLGPDGKIYFPLYNQPYLGVIHQPNQPGLACQPQTHYVSLGNGLAQLGLPTFNQSRFTPAVDTTAALESFDEIALEDIEFKVDETLVLDNIHFDYAQYTLQTPSFEELDRLAWVLNRSPELSIKLSGHTDNLGNKTENIVLSQKRAEAVKNYLLEKGVAASRISYEGFGSRQPIASNAT
ncbi:MAG: OmpA family protein, partial [Bacteroidia bacterium]|nr:OmpA family protein [Bacteroidia bacterium]